MSNQVTNCVDCAWSRRSVHFVECRRQQHPPPNSWRVLETSKLVRADGDCREGGRVQRLVYSSAAAANRHIGRLLPPGAGHAVPRFRAIGEALRELPATDAIPRHRYYGDDVLVDEVLWEARAEGQPFGINGQGRPANGPRRIRSVPAPPSGTRRPYRSARC